MKLQETMSLFFLEKTKTKEREGGERGGEQEQQRERREQKSKAGPYAWDIGQLIFARKTFGFEYH